LEYGISCSDEEQQEPEIPRIYNSAMHDFTQPFSGCEKLPIDPLRRIAQLKSHQKRQKWTENEERPTVVGLSSYQVRTQL